MFAARTNKFMFVALLIGAVITAQSRAMSDEIEYSAEFMKGFRAGQAFSTVTTVPFLFVLLEKMDHEAKGQKTELLDPSSSMRALVYNQLFYSAEVIDKVVKDTHSQPLRKRYEKDLAEIADYFHRTEPAMMRQGDYESKRKAVLEEYRDLKVSDEMVNRHMEIYDRQHRTVRMLNKYRSASKDRGKK